MEDPTVFRVNRLDAHSDHTVFLDLQDAISGKSSLRQSLDGQWKFHYGNFPAERAVDFWQEGYDDSSFGSITVPGHLETQGYDHIQYINRLYVWLNGHFIGYSEDSSTPSDFDLTFTEKDGYYFSNGSK